MDEWGEERWQGEEGEGVVWFVLAGLGQECAVVWQPGREWGWVVWQLAWGSGEQLGGMVDCCLVLFCSMRWRVLPEGRPLLGIGWSCRVVH